MVRRALLCVIAAAVAAVPVLAGEVSGSNCCMTQPGVERTVAQLADGVRITLTARDKATVETLQARTATCPREACGDCPMHAEGVTRTVEKTESGVTITATSSDQALVAKLQQHVEAAAGCQARQSGEKPGCCKPKAAHSSCQRGAASS